MSATNPPLSNTPSSGEQEGLNQLRNTVEEVQGVLVSSQKKLTETEAKIKKLTDDVQTIVDTGVKQQNIIGNMVNEIRHSQGLVFFGFIILIVMMGAIIIDVAINVWTKADSANTQNSEQGIHRRFYYYGY